jgi:tetratricopeptide (TPR) repeat protein
MLFFREEYRPNFSRLVQAIDSGVPSADAIVKVYGRSVAQVEKDLQAYLRGTSFRGGLVPAKFDKNTDELPVEPLSEFDVTLMFTDLTNRPGKEKAVTAKLEELTKLDPKRPEPYRGLGYLAWRAGHNEEAVADFAKAYERGDRDPKLLWDYGRLAERRNAPDAIRILSELLDKDQDRMEVRLELAETQLREKRAIQALATLQPVRKITPDNAARFFRLTIYGYMMSGDEKRAKETAERFKSLAKTDEQRQEANRLLAQVSMRDARPEQIPQEIGEAPRPTLRRGDGDSKTSPEVPPPPPPPSASGKFVALECQQGKARMVIEVEGGGRQIFLIEDPSGIAIKTGSTRTVDLACGPQKQPAAVRVEYAPSSQPGIKGEVRTLAFE